MFYFVSEWSKSIECTIRNSILNKYRNMVCFDHFFWTAKGQESQGPYHVNYYAQLYHFFSKFGRTYHSFEEKTKPSIGEILLRKLWIIAANETKNNVRKEVKIIIYRVYQQVLVKISNLREIWSLNFFVKKICQSEVRSALLS